MAHPGRRPVNGDPASPWPRIDPDDGRPLRPFGPEVLTGGGRCYRQGPEAQKGEAEVEDSDHNLTYYPPNPTTGWDDTNVSPSQAESPDERSGERSGSADGPELARNRSSDKDTRIDGSVPWLKLLDPVGWTGLGLMFIGLVLLIVAGVLFLPLTPPQATLLAGFGVVLAALLTFYNGHLTRISTEQTAAREIAQAQAEAAEQSTRADNQLKEQQLQWNETHRQELIRDLRSRYTIAASQLGDGSPAIRLAGVYALISLGDDWRAFGNEAELNVCIDLSLAYLRTAQAHTDSLAHEGASTQGAPSAHQGPSTTGRGEPEVRKTILYTFLRRMYNLR